MRLNILCEIQYLQIMSIYGIMYISIWQTVIFINTFIANWQKGRSYDYIKRQWQEYPDKKDNSLQCGT